MPKLVGNSRRFCDGIDRRRFMAVGSLGFFGLSLEHLLAAESSSGESAPGTAGRHNNRSVILIWQHGGPSQLDTFDMKPAASSEVRGLYQSIATKLPGVRICEKMPYHAEVMDKVNIIRSFTHTTNDHFAGAHWMLVRQSILSCREGRVQRLTWKRRIPKFANDTATAGGPKRYWHAA